MNQNSNDADRLLKIVGDGDDDALGALIENYRPMLRAEAMRSLALVQARVDPSDIVQHTWWSAFRAFPKFEGDVDAFVGWLRKIHERNLRDAVRDQHAESEPFNVKFRRRLCCRRNQRRRRLQVRNFCRLNNEN